MMKQSSRPLSTSVMKIICCALGVFLTTGAAHAAEIELDTLMRLLSQRRSGEARFVEERHITGLEKPLRSSGRLTFQVPDRFARHTEAPRAESVEIEGSVATLRRGGRTLRLSLDAIPEFGILADAIRGTLTGNGRALRLGFDTQVTGTAEAWILRLRPLDDRVSVQVIEFVLRGRLGDVRQIETRMNSGDLSLMLVDTPMPLQGEPSR